MVTTDFRQHFKGVFNDIIDKTQVGDMYPIEALAVAKDMETIAKAIKERYTDEALLDAEKWNNTSVSGYDVSRKNGATRYKFDHIAAWKVKKGELKLIEDRAKASAQALKSGETIVDNDGVVVEAAEIVLGSEQVVLKLKKQKND